jgi:hypothetical protein
MLIYLDVIGEISHFDVAKLAEAEVKLPASFGLAGKRWSKVAPCFSGPHPKHPRPELMVQGPGSVMTLARR